MSSNKLRLIHSAQTTPSANDLDKLVRQMIEAVDMEPRAYYRAPADTASDRKIELLERKVLEIEDWASRVEKWAFDEVRRAQEEVTASSETLAQCRLRIYELETLATDLAEQLQSSQSRSRQPVARQPVAKRESPPPIPKASLPATADMGEAREWPSRGSSLISAGDFSLETWTA